MVYLRRLYRASSYIIIAECAASFFEIEFNGGLNLLTYFSILFRGDVFNVSGIFFLFQVSRVNWTIYFSFCDARAEESAACP